jgi:hypothetical protein
MEGSITLWLPDDWSLEKIRHPYQRTYVDDKKARWEDDDQYCNKYGKKQHKPLKLKIILKGVVIVIFGISEASYG